MAHGQESSSTEPAGAAAALCASGCGFFGSPATKNMCSKCYRDHLKATDMPAPAPAAAEVKIKADVTDLAVNFKTSASLHDSAAAVEVAAEEVPVKKAAPTRCMSCKKKVGLLGFACRCGGTFCSLHRYVDGHACNFDFKKVDREKIAQQNPLVKAPKIDKI